MGEVDREGRIDVVKRAEKILGLSFRNPLLLQRALVHRSFLNENPQFAVGTNERLEFLGDAVVELIVSDHLYTHFPTAEEDRLTTMRAALVRAETLGRLARDLGLGRLLYLNDAAEAAGARTRIRFLGQVFESVVGAIYVDRGPDVAREFVLRHLGPDLERVAREPALEDAKSRLQVIAHSTTGLTPVYEVVSAIGPGHQPHYVVQVRLSDEVVGRGEGKKKKEAEQLAATEALGRFPRTAG